MRSGHGFKPGMSSGARNPCSYGGRARQTARKTRPVFLATLLAGRTSLRKPRGAANAKLLASRLAGTGLRGPPVARPELARRTAGTIGSRPEAERPSIHARCPKGRWGTDALCGAVRSPILVKPPEAANKHYYQISLIIVH